MAISKIEPNSERVAECATRMKEIIETTWSRDPSLNDAESEEFKRLKTEIEAMGLWVSWSTSLNMDDPLNPKIRAEIDVLIPKNTVIQ